MQRNTQKKKYAGFGSHHHAAMHDDSMNGSVRSMSGSMNESGLSVRRGSLKGKSRPSGGGSRLPTTKILLGIIFLVALLLCCSVLFYVAHQETASDGLWSGGSADVGGIGGSSLENTLKDKTNIERKAASIEELDTLPRQKELDGSSTLIKTDQEQFTSTVPSTKASNGGPSEPVRKWAYVFMLGGIAPSSQHSHNETTSAHHRGLWYNILVSIQILKDSGSVADMILLVHHIQPYDSLPPKDVAILKALNVTLHYVPPTFTFAGQDAIQGFTTINLEKFRMLDFLQYSRVFYLEADFMPHCNLDYLLELSEPLQEVPNQFRLQENVLVSIDNSPASGSFFILKPGFGYYKNFLNLMIKYPTKLPYFNKTVGWGHRMAWQPRKDNMGGDGWYSIHSLQWKKESKKIKDQWYFDGADNDAGLLYHWAKYVRNRTSLIVRDRIYTIDMMANPGKFNYTANAMIKGNPLKSYSCLKTEDESTGGIGAVWFATSEQRKDASPFGIAPYRDFAQWDKKDSQPWNLEKAPDPSSSVTSARQRWFSVLRHLDQRFTMGLGLNGNSDNSQQTPTREETDWKYVPKTKSTDLLPVWSTKVHALKLWAKQQHANLVAKEIVFQPPLLVPKDQQGIHRSHLLSANEPEKRILQLKTNEDGDASTIIKEPLPCNCSTPLELDPCSIPKDPKVEDWMEQQLGLKFSKHRPACPGGARHHMHVLLPFANLDVETARAAYCSVQCQNYPTSDVTIYLYEDGPSAPGDNSEGDSTIDAAKSNVLETLCGTKGVMRLNLPMLSDDVATSANTNEEFDMMAQSWASETMANYTNSVQLQKDTDLVGNTICLSSNEHSGPGGAKYWAFRLVQAQAEVNDVVIVVDGDDELNTPKALQVINKVYLEQSAWMTYGSYSGKYSDQTKAIPRSIQTGSEAFQPRKDQPTWRFGHTRTFKAHLLPHIGRRDFSFKDRSWLIKASDRGFVYRALELSGVDRVAFIPSALYKYKWSVSASTVAQVPKEMRVAQLEHVQSLEPSERIGLPFHVVLVCWGRTYLLKEQLVWLQEQTLAESRQVVVHLLSNNADTHPEVVQTVDTFKAKQTSWDQFAKYVPLQIKIVQNDINWHAFSRFLYVYELRKTEPIDVVFFVDDDQYWVPDFLASLLTYHRPKGMTAWYGRTFTKTDKYTGLASYWGTDLKWHEIITRDRTDISTFAYAGPGGSVFDTNLWLFDQQLLRLKDDMKQYYEFDDVWTSFCVDALLGWEHRRIPTPIPVDIANCNKTDYETSIFPNLPEGIPEKLLAMHADMAEHMLSVATYGDGTRGTKADMFTELQVKYRWEVTRPIDTPRLKTTLELESFSQVGVSPVLPTHLMLEAPEKKPKRAFVCITGQFERLELNSKIHKFLRPIIGLGYEVDVALVLSGGKSSFTNEHKAEAFTPFFKKLEDAVADLEKYNVTVLSPKSEADGGIYDRLENPKVHQQYLIHLYEAQTYMRTFDEQLGRAENHPRIYESYHRCRQYAEENVQKAASRALATNPDLVEHQIPTMETYYNVYLRMRDDVGLVEVPPKAVMTTLLNPPPNSITVTGCRGWGGMNDRFAAVSPDVAYTYFQRPYDMFIQGEELKDHIVNNPESFLLYAYVTAGIHVFANRKLKGVSRFFKDPDTKKSKIYTEDKNRERCLQEPNLHTDHLLSLYELDF